MKNKQYIILISLGLILLFLFGLRSFLNLFVAVATPEIVVESKVLQKEAPPEQQVPKVWPCDPKVKSKDCDK